MALQKTDKEIAQMREGGALLSRALQAVVDAVRPGITMRELDEIGTRVIEEGGGTPSFKGYKAGGTVPFPSAVCISANDEVVHGIGSREVELKEGDIVGLDIGLWLHGLATDMAVTVPVGNVSEDRMELMRVTRDAMYAGVEAAQVGKYVHHIAAAVEDAIDTKKYGIVKALVGHGVGHEVHEDPNVPNYRSNRFPKVKLIKNMCLAIEPMVTGGSERVQTDKDGWTIRTIDGSASAHFEVTIALLESGPEILTPQPTVPGL